MGRILPHATANESPHGAALVARRDFRQELPEVGRPICRIRWRKTITYISVRAIRA